MDFIHAIIIAIVEGITEFLPVSSTAHMMITAKLMGVPTTEFVKTFEISIQFGAIMAVLVFYWRVFLLDWEKVIKVGVAFIPTAVIGFILYKMIKQFLLGNLYVVVWSLFIGGVILIVFEKLHKSKPQDVARVEDITYTQALMIGLCQSLAVIPGVSRSAATIIGGLTMGINRPTIVEFSFLLAVPTMLAATVLDLLKSNATINADQWLVLAVGFCVAFLVALGSIKFLLGYVRRFDFIPFGIYRIIAAVVLAIILYMGGNA